MRERNREERMNTGRKKREFGYLWNRKTAVGTMFNSEVGYNHLGLLAYNSYIVDDFSKKCR